jgi:twinkle protein
VGELLRHEPCPACGSKDNLARYRDGSAWCFGCHHREKGEGKIEAREEPTTNNKPFVPMVGEYRDLGKRGIDRATCEKWGYQVGETGDGVCHIANYRGEGGKLVAQKIRMPGKKFKVLGNGKSLPLYGQWLWGKGKHIIITEGEIDALSVSQSQDNKWPVVSLPNGAQSAEKAITQAYEYLDAFDNITLMFDMDAPGQEAAEVAAALLPVGKVRIASLPEKDPNEVLVEHGAAELVRCFWNAKPWRPDGIRQPADAEEEFFNPDPVRGINFPWEAWNEVVGPWRDVGFLMLTAGSGVGKTTILREMLVSALEQGETCGAMFLEDDSMVETLENLVAIKLSKNITLDRARATPEEIRGAFEWFKAKPLYIYDSFGSNDVDAICSRMRYLVQACGCKRIFFDHLSIMVSGLEGDERRIIDQAMTKFAKLVTELKFSLNCVVHLRRPQGDKGHEDGAKVSANQLRGSHSIMQLSHVVIGINKDEDDPNGPNNYPVCLKNRKNGGKKGEMGMLSYDRETGRLSDCPF